MICCIVFRQKFYLTDVLKYKVFNITQKLAGWLYSSGVRTLALNLELVR